MDYRKSNRASASLEIQYRSTNPTLGENRRAVTRDISQTGAALVVDHQLTPRTKVDMELSIPASPEKPLRIEAEVIWQRKVSGGLAPTFLAGIQFLKTDSIAQEQITSFVSSQLGRHSQAADHMAVDSFDRKVRIAQEPWPIQMATLRTTYARVAATGAYLPSARLTNADLVKSRGENLQPILLQRALGAVERRAVSPGEQGADLMVQAGKAILSKAGCDPRDLDRIICSLDPGDAVAPSTAVAVQAKLGATCPAYDVTMSCAGWICGIDQGLRALASGEERVLVLAGSTVGSSLPFRDLKHRAIFGDGAGGFLLEAAQPGDLLTTALWADGRFYSKIFAPYSWSAHPQDIPAEYKGYFYMDPDQNVFFDQLTRVLPPFLKRLLLEADVAVEDIDHFLLHQPSIPLFEHSLKLLKMIPRSKVFDFFSRYGNIVSAEMPVMLDEGIRSGLIKRGDLVCIVTYGAGFTMAGLVMRY